MAEVVEVDVADAVEAGVVKWSFKSSMVEYSARVVVG